MKKYINTIVLSLVLISIVFEVNAQQDPNFTLYNFNLNIINPAVAGMQNDTELSLVYRDQWIGVPDAPRTASLIYSRGLGSNLGIAFTAMNDKVFVLDETDLAIDISYALQLQENTILRFGMKFGGGFTNIDLTKAYNQGDDPLFLQNQSFFNPHIGAGIYIDNPKFYISLSTPNFLNGERYYKKGNIPSVAVDNMHLYLGAGYNFTLSNSLVLTPRIMLRGVSGTPTSYDLGASLLISNVLNTGVNYRVNEMYSIYGVYSLFKNLQLGISYDITNRSAVLLNDDGSLEFIVKYRF